MLSSPPPGSTAFSSSPISDYFERLQKASARLRVICVHACHRRTAANARCTTSPVMSTSRRGLYRSVHQLSSLAEARMTTLWDGFEKMKIMQASTSEQRVVETMRSTTLHELLVRADLGLDLLQIDARVTTSRSSRRSTRSAVRPRFVNYRRASSAERSPRLPLHDPRPRLRAVRLGRCTLPIATRWAASSSTCPRSPTARHSTHVTPTTGPRPRHVSTASSSSSGSAPANGRSARRTATTTGGRAPRGTAGDQLDALTG